MSAVWFVAVKWSVFVMLLLYFHSFVKTVGRSFRSAYTSWLSKHRQLKAGRNVSLFIFKKSISRQGLWIMERSALKIWCAIFPHPHRRKRVCGSEKRSSVVQRNLRRIWYFPANLVKTGRGEAKCWSWAWQKKLRQSSLSSLTGFNWLNYFSYRVSKPNFQFQIAKSYGFEILVCDL